MGKFGTLGVSDVCYKICQAARDKACAEKFKEQYDEHGMICVGVQPLSPEAEVWTELENKNLLLRNYPIGAMSTIHRRYFNTRNIVTDAMNASAQKQSDHDVPVIRPVVASIGVACAYDIRDNKDNELLMRFYIFVSGEEDFARECCLAARTAIREWSKANTYEDVRGIIRPCVWTPRIQSA